MIEAIGFILVGLAVLVSWQLERLTLMIAQGIELILDTIPRGKP